MVVMLWCRYVRSHIISSDYEGCVTLWDVDTGAAVNEYEAHDKRIWSIDYCTSDPFLFVSGSDDGFIKVHPRNLHIPLSVCLSACIAYLGQIFASTFPFCMAYFCLCNTMQRHF